MRRSRAHRVRRVPRGGPRPQMSNYALTGELDSLRNLALIIPAVFLGVAAFLVNVVVSRLVFLERTQIAVLKAVGFTDRRIALHYLGLVASIALIGAVLGVGSGVWASHWMTTSTPTSTGSRPGSTACLRGRRDDARDRAPRRRHRRARGRVPDRADASRTGDAAPGAARLPQEAGRVARPRPGPRSLRADGRARDRAPPGAVPVLGRGIAMGIACSSSAGSAGTRSTTCSTRSTSASTTRI